MHAPTGPLSNAWQLATVFSQEDNGNAKLVKWMRSHQEVWDGRDIKTWMRNAKLIANLQPFRTLRR